MPENSEPRTVEPRPADTRPRSKRTVTYEGPQYRFAKMAQFRAMVTTAGLVAIGAAGDSLTWWLTAIGMLLAHLVIMATRYEDMTTVKRYDEVVTWIDGETAADRKTERGTLFIHEITLPRLWGWVVVRALSIGLILALIVGSEQIVGLFPFMHGLPLATCQVASVVAYAVGTAVPSLHTVHKFPAFYTDEQAKAQVKATLHAS